MSNFAFLQTEWPQLFSEAQKAEALVYPDPRTACFYARRALEMVLQWAYKSDATLKLPYQDNLSALVHEPTFVKLAGPMVHAKAVLINRIGNSAVHSGRAVTVNDSFNAVRELFQVSYWLARTYSRTPPASELKFNGNLLPKTSAIPPQTQAKVLQLEADVSARDTRLVDLLAEHENLLTGKLELDAEVQRLRALASDPAAQQHRLHSEAHDAARLTAVMRLLPDAFVNQFKGSAQTPNGTAIRISFKPNPRFAPPTLESRILTGIHGEIWIDPTDLRVVRIEGHFFREVDYGWGILGTL